MKREHGQFLSLLDNGGNAFLLHHLEALGFFQYPGVITESIGDTWEVFWEQ